MRVPEGDVEIVTHVFFSSSRGHYSVDWAGLLAASTLRALPVALTYLLLWHLCIEGITAGVTKG